MSNEYTFNCDYCKAVVTVPTKDLIYLDGFVFGKCPHGHAFYAKGEPPAGHVNPSPIIDKVIDMKKDRQKIPTPHPAFNMFCPKCKKHVLLNPFDCSVYAHTPGWNVYFFDCECGGQIFGGAPDSMPNYSDWEEARI